MNAFHIAVISAVFVAMAIWFIPTIKDRLRIRRIKKARKNFFRGISGFEFCLGLAFLKEGILRLLIGERVAITFECETEEKMYHERWKGIVRDIDSGWVDITKEPNSDKEKNVYARIDINYIRKIEILS